MSDDTNKPKEFHSVRVWAFLKYVEFMTGRKMPDGYLARLKAQYRLAQATQPRVPDESTVPPESQAQAVADDGGADGQTPGTTPAAEKPNGD